MKLRSRLLTGVPAICVAFAMLALSAPAAFAGESQIRFGIGFEQGLVPGSNCIRGRAAPSAQVELTWRSATGELKANTSVMSSDAGGYWEFCSSDATLVTGDLLKANDGLTQRKFTMPLVTLKADRSANEFRGHAPANSNFTLWYDSGGPFSDHNTSVDLTSDAHGHWQFDDGEDVRAGAYAYFDWSNAIGDVVTVDAQAPGVDVTVGSAKFIAYTNPGQALRVNLRDGLTNVVKAIGIVPAGSSQGVFRDAGGQRVAVSVGDRVVAHKVAADLDWIVPEIEATADVAADLVSGDCHDAGNLGEIAIVRIVRTGHTRGFAVAFDVDETGHFDLDFGEEEGFLYDPANIKRGDRIVVQCSLDTGDNVSQTFLVP